MLLGMIALIGTLHNHAHYEMTMDADSYVRQWCRASAETKRLVSVMVETWITNEKERNSRSSRIA